MKLYNINFINQERDLNFKNLSIQVKKNKKK